jgi:hypothetical protein
MVALAVSDPILDTPGGTLNARCRDEACAHVWTVAYLPMPMESVTLLMQRAACPMCADLDPFVMPQQALERAELRAEVRAEFREAVNRFRSECVEGAEPDPDTTAASACAGGKPDTS